MVVDENHAKNFNSGTIWFTGLSTGLATDGASSQTVEAQKSE
jgi:hypothetical protein